MSYCPSCGASIYVDDKYCAGCGETLVVTKRYPGVLWLLPIFFGFIGGIVASLISGLKYEASWWELLVVGIITQIFAIIVWIFWWAAIFTAVMALE